jgi:hypothetical protein
MLAPDLGRATMNKAQARWLAGAAALAAGTMGAAGAAQGQELRAGAMVEGTVESADAPASIPLRVAPGQAVQLDALPGAAAASGLDLLFKVYGPDGELVGEDDDGSGSLNPRYSLYSPAGGLYKVDVGALGSGGPFTLLARESTFRPQVPKPLDFSGGSAERAVTFPADDKAIYAFTARRGEILSVTVTADEGTDVDPLVELFKGGAASGTALAQDDDSGGGLNARLVAPIPEDGTYTVRVSTVSGTGGATLALARMTARTATLGTLALGQAATVGLNPDSPFIIEGAEHRLWPYALYRLPAGMTAASLAGKTLELAADSEALDPWLEVGFETPFGFTPVLSNDDAEGTNSRLTLDPAAFSGADAARWWDLLRIRVLAPPGTAGEVELTATPED